MPIVIFVVCAPAEPVREFVKDAQWLGPSVACIRIVEDFKQQRLYLWSPEGEQRLERLERKGSRRLFCFDEQNFTIVDTSDTIYNYRNGNEEKVYSGDVSNAIAIHPMLNLVIDINKIDPWLPLVFSNQNTYLVARNWKTGSVFASERLSTSAEFLIYADTALLHGKCVYFIGRSSAQDRSKRFLSRYRLTPELESASIDIHGVYTALSIVQDKIILLCKDKDTVSVWLIKDNEDKLESSELVSYTLDSDEATFEWTEQGLFILDSLSHSFRLIDPSGEILVDTKLGFNRFAPSPDGHHLLLWNVGMASIFAQHVNRIGVSPPSKLQTGSPVVIGVEPVSARD